MQPPKGTVYLKCLKCLKCETSGRTLSVERGSPRVLLPDVHRCAHARAARERAAQEQTDAGLLLGARQGARHAGSMTRAGSHVADTTYIYIYHTPHRTVYGTGKASPRDFLSHHTAALSSALVAADANNVLAAAAALDHRLVSGRHGE